MDYVVTFIGHIKENSRPDGFPYKVKNVMVVRADTIRVLVDEIEKQAQKFLLMQGMVVHKDESKPQVVQEYGSETEDILDKRIFVPMSSISYMETETKRLTNDLGGETERFFN